ETQQSFSSALEQKEQDIVRLKDELGGIGQEVGSISGTVTTLEKLSKTDPELLQK
ncbi:hypothetical protein GWO43_04295, partial [candidate division KSB1 bacterium]|nr:hypothetical protein [candidate division KSB1 bacterium]NIS23055.1 hypothetical protein [candidate division KSB1 bacterium]NIT70120.1 hypothetical protein [candidate division KSB1 bacterium]NIU93164.1 hypothetical protein [candidate division KSB1 bacterium]NIW68204.1 hypothetical protein [candidate division KSB1 bacterium]